MDATRSLRIVLAAGLGLLIGGLAFIALGDDGGQTAWAAPSAVNWGPYIAITSDAIDNEEPVVAYNTQREEYLVVWADRYTATAPSAIVAQRVRGDGQLIGGQIQIVSSTSILYTHPAVAYSPLHDAYLVVFDYDADPTSHTDYDIAARPVNGDGALGTMYGVQIDFDNHWLPALAYNTTDDEFLIVWEAENTTRTLRYIRSQRVHADTWAFEPGQPTIATGEGTGGDGKNRLRPDVAYDPAQNRYLVAYTLQYGPGDGDILAKMLPASLLPDPLTLIEIAVCDNGRDQGAAAVAAGPGEYLVVWQDQDTAANWDIFARRLRASDGVPQGPGDGFLVAQFLGQPSTAPDVAYGPVYGFVVTWISYSASYLEDVYADYVMPGQDAVGTLPFMIGGGMSTSQKDPDIACTPSGTCLAVYEDNRVAYGGVTGDYDIYGQFMLPYWVYLPLAVK